MGQTYLMESNKIIQEEQSLPKKKYEYVTITSWVNKQVDLEECLEICSEMDMESEHDAEIEFFVRVSQMRNLKEMEYLVLKLMG